jgi:hypothetical protein
MSAIAWAIVFIGMVFSDAANMYMAHNTRYEGESTAAGLAIFCLFMCFICTIREMME